MRRNGPDCEAAHFDALSSIFGSTRRRTQWCLLIGVALLCVFQLQEEVVVYGIRPTPTQTTAVQNDTHSQKRPNTTLQEEETGTEMRPTPATRIKNETHSQHPPETTQKEETVADIMPDTTVKNDTLSLTQPGIVKNANHSLQQPGTERSVYQIGFDYMFWSKGSKLCQAIRNVTGVDELGDEPHYFTEKKPPPLFNFTLNCTGLPASTGNWITAFYMMKLTAAAGRVDLQFQCHTGMENLETDLLPWFTGYYPAPTNDTWPYDFGWPEAKAACTGVYRNVPLHHMTRGIQHDMRRIAVAILGPRGFDTSSLDLTQLENLLGGIEEKPFDTQLDIDDAAIHFRCGDVFGITNKNYYGLIKFKEYVQRIPNETRSIGIHTQPFDEKLVRPIDREPTEQCKKAVFVLVDYLQKAFPNTKITIRNTENDTLPLTYARLTMAAQTIVSMSTFGIFPAIGTFGEGFYQKSGGQNRFAKNVAEILQNFHTMEGPIISSPDIRDADWKDIVKFLTEP
jgi:hypothetical protein